MVDRAALGQVFSEYEYFGFPCGSIHWLLHTHHHPLSGANTVGQILADVPSGLSLTPLQDTKNNSKSSQTFFQTSSQNIVIYFNIHIKPA
jgi:hypothetical protein